MHSCHSPAYAPLLFICSLGKISRLTRSHVCFLSFSLWDQFSGLLYSVLQLDCDQQEKSSVKPSLGGFIIIQEQSKYQWWCLLLYDLNKDNFWYLSCIRHRENYGPDVEDIITKMGQWTSWKRVWALDMPPSQSHLISILHFRCNFPSLLFSQYLPRLPSVHTRQFTCPPFLFRSRSLMTIKQNKTKQGISSFSSTQHLHMY